MSYLRATDLQGLSQLAIDGVIGTTSLVEELHYAIQRVSGPSLPSKQRRTRGITGLVYRSIHGITGAVGYSSNLAFRQITPRLTPAPSTPKRDQVLAALNGVLGDHLQATSNPLALEMTLRYQGRRLDPELEKRLCADLPTHSRKIAVFVHGLCMSHHHWAPEEYEPNAGNLPEIVFETAGYLPLCVSYNSGRRIAHNGADLAMLLESLVQDWPEPVDELVLIGHSMGGLLARSACHFGQEKDHAWVNRARQLITLGSPHHGAPLERIGHQVDRALALTPFTRPFTRLGGIRSAGITDLRHGDLLESKPCQILQPPAHLRLCTLAACLGESQQNVKSRLLGDGLVPLASALGQHDDSACHLDVSPEHSTILYGVGHMDLPRHPGSAEAVLGWLRESGDQT